MSINEEMVRILIVDDEEGFRDQLARWLRNQSNRYIVDVAANGLEALGLLAEGNVYDIVLLDQILDTGISGTELLQRIRHKYPETEVIMMTGWGIHIDSGLTALRGGAYRYISKTADKAEIPLLIEIAAGRKRATAESQENSLINSQHRKKNPPSDTSQLTDGQTVQELNSIKQALMIDQVEQINSSIYDTNIKPRPHLFEQDGLCANYPLSPSPNEYFVAHEVSLEKIEDLRHALKLGLVDTQLKPYTADQDIQPGHILCKIAAKIQTTAFCIFDLPQSPAKSGAANVYLELGIAIGLGRPFILIKNGKAEVPSLLEGLDTFGFSSYSGLRRKVGEQIQVGQFSSILPQEDVSSTATYFLADGEFEQEDFREAIQNALEDYGLQSVYLGAGQVEPELVLTQLIRNIQAARFGIYRIDQRASANTFLALGVAIGLNRPWLLVGRDGSDIPQDVRGLSNFNFRSFTQLETEFAKRCEAFLKRYAGQVQSDYRQPIAEADITAPPIESSSLSTHKVKPSEKQNLRSTIPPHLYRQLRSALLDCGPIGNDDQLRAVFANASLSPWRHAVPQAANPADRTDAVIAFLIKHRRADTKENALVLFLQVLSERLDPNDECHTRLADLAELLEHSLGNG